MTAEGEEAPVPGDDGVTPIHDEQDRVFGEQDRVFGERRLVHRLGAVREQEAGPGDAA